MRYHGREIDPISLWAEFCDVKEGDGPFLPLTYCPNPNHENTHSPAFQINIDKPLVHCFAGCGISGTYEHAIQIITGDNHREARRRILRHARNAPVAKRKGTRARDRKRGTDRRGRRNDKEFHYDLSRYSYLPPFALDYLNQRGIGAVSIAQWELGWDQDEQRIVIPVKDNRGITRMLIRRAVKPNDFPKYLYSEGVDKTSLLFGACHIDLGMIKSQGLILVEGSLDTIRQHDNGFPNTVGILGTYLSDIQLGIIAGWNPKRITLMLDKDSAGIAGIVHAKNKLKKFPLYVVRYPKGISDPAEFDRKGARKAVGNAISIMQFSRIAGPIANPTRR